MIRLFSHLMTTGKIILSVSFIALPSIAARQMVTSAVDSVAGSLRSAVNNAVAGDTVMFNIPGMDTVVINNEIAIAKDIVITGINLRTGKNVFVTVDTWGKMKYRVFNITDGNVVLRNLFLYGGNPQNGGGIYEDGIGTKVILDSIEIKCGHSTINGGCVFNGTGNLIITNSTLEFGASGSFGGGIYNGTGSVEIVNSLIYYNNSSTSGGGVYNSSGNMKITNCCISSNRCANPYDYTTSPGGGISNDVGNLIITNSSVIYNESAYSTSTNGEGNSTGGGLFNGSGNMIINNCFVYYNISTASCPHYYTLSTGGGICNSTGKLAIFNSTVSKNEAAASSGASSNSYGGGIYNGPGFLTIVNCTVCNNSGEAGGGAYNSAGNLKVVYSTIINNYSSVSGGMVTENALCYLLNSIIVNNLKSTILYGGQRFSDYNVHGGRAINTIIGFGNIIGLGKMLTLTNCDTGLTAKPVFGDTTPTLDSNGGPTMTFTLDSNSIANGAGVRAGTYTKDTIINNKPDSIMKVAYYSGENWLSIETDSIVPVGTQVAEILTDQRGVARKNPPCIGSFESPYQRSPVINIINTRNTFLPDISLVHYNLRLEFSSGTKATIELFNLSGRKLFSNSVSVKPGIIAIALPSLAHGPLICRLTTPQGITTHKIMR